MATIITPKAQQIFTAAAAEAKALGHRYVGSEHLLLAIAKDGESGQAGIGGKALRALKVSSKQVLREITRMVGSAHVKMVKAPKKHVMYPQLKTKSPKKK